MHSMYYRYSIIIVNTEDRFVTEWKRKQTGRKDLIKFLIYDTHEK
jgi:hypothetical protein